MFGELEVFGALGVGECVWQVRLASEAGVETAVWLWLMMGETAVMIMGNGWGLTVELGVLPLLECESVWVGSEAL